MSGFGVARCSRKGCKKAASKPLYCRCGAAFCSEACFVQAWHAEHRRVCTSAVEISKLLDAACSPTSESSSPSKRGGRNGAGKLCSVALSRTTPTASSTASQDLSARASSTEFSEETSTRNGSVDASTRNGSFEDGAEIRSLKTSDLALQLESSWPQEPPSGYMSQAARRPSQELFGGATPAAAKFRPEDFSNCGENIGEGSYGAVHKVVRKGTGEVFAIKVVPKMKIRETSMSSYLAREVKTQMRLRHDRILRLHAYFEDKDDVRLLLEYASGGSLMQTLRKRDIITHKEAASIFVDVAGALHYLHRQGVIHRDVKPENILLCDGGVAKLADFGWCAEFSDGMRNTFCGTWDYLSPEMVQGQPHDTAVDIWAVGVLLYEMLVGRPPFADRSQDASLKRISSADLRLPEILAGPVGDLIKQLLRKSPRDRVPLDEAMLHPWVHQSMKGSSLSEGTQVLDISMQVPAMSTSLSLKQGAVDAPQKKESSDKLASQVGESMDLAAAALAARVQRLQNLGAPSTPLGSAVSVATTVQAPPAASAASGSHAEMQRKMEARRAKLEGTEAPLSARSFDIRSESSRVRPLPSASSAPFLKQPDQSPSSAPVRSTPLRPATPVRSTPLRPVASGTLSESSLKRSQHTSSKSPQGRPSPTQSPGSTHSLATVLCGDSPQRSLPSTVSPPGPPARQSPTSLASEDSPQRPRLSSSSPHALSRQSPTQPLGSAPSLRQASPAGAAFGVASASEAAADDSLDISFDARSCRSFASNATTVRCVSRRKKEEDEEERCRKEAEERRRREDDDRRLLQEQEERQRKVAVEAEERRRNEEDERRRKREEAAENERRRQAAAEADERRRREEDERRRLQEEEDRRKEEEEKQERRRREAAAAEERRRNEENERRRRQEEELQRKKQEEEEAENERRRQAAAEADERRRREDHERHLLQEQKDRRRKQEEEHERRRKEAAEAEERRRIEENEFRQKQEEDRRKKDEEEAENERCRKEAAEAEERRRRDEEERRLLQLQEDRRKEEEEKQERRRKEAAEAEERRRIEYEERRRQEEEDRRKKDEEEAENERRRKEAAEAEERRRREEDERRWLREQEEREECRRREAAEAEERRRSEENERRRRQEEEYRRKKAEEEEEDLRRREEEERRWLQEQEERRKQEEEEREERRRQRAAEAEERRRREDEERRQLQEQEERFYEEEEKLQRQARISPSQERRRKEAAEAEECRRMAEQAAEGLRRRETSSPTRDSFPSRDSRPLGTADLAQLRAADANRSSNAARLLSATLEDSTQESVVAPLGAGTWKDTPMFDRVRAFARKGAAGHTDLVEDLDNTVASLAATVRLPGAQEAKKPDLSLPVQSRHPEVMHVGGSEVRPELAMDLVDKTFRVGSSPLPSAADLKKPLPTADDLRMLMPDARTRPLGSASRSATPTRPLGSSSRSATPIGSSSRAATPTGSSSRAATPLGSSPTPRTSERFKRDVDSNLDEMLSKTFGDVKSVRKQARPPPVSVPARDLDVDKDEISPVSNNWTYFGWARPSTVSTGLLRGDSSAQGTSQGSTGRAGQGREEYTRERTPEFARERTPEFASRRESLDLRDPFGCPSETTESSYQTTTEQSCDGDEDEEYTGDEEYNIYGSVPRMSSTPRFSERTPVRGRADGVRGPLQTADVDIGYREKPLEFGALFGSRPLGSLPGGL